MNLSIYKLMLMNQNLNHKSHNKAKKQSTRHYLLSQLNNLLRYTKFPSIWLNKYQAALHNTMKIFLTLFIVKLMTVPQGRFLENTPTLSGYRQHWKEKCQDCWSQPFHPSLFLLKSILLITLLKLERRDIEYHILNDIAIDRILI